MIGDFSEKRENEKKGKFSKKKKKLQKGLVPKTVFDPTRIVRFGPSSETNLQPFFDEFRPRKKEKKKGKTVKEEKEK